MMARKKSINDSNNKESFCYSAVVIGTSAGGMAALQILFRQVDKKFALPIIVVQHLYPESDDFLAQSLNLISPLPVKEASEKETIRAGEVFISPANYHLLIEEDRTFSLNIDPKVNFCRPSIDVLFESAAQVYNRQLIGVLLTGANNDGARGLKRIKEMGGITIAQDPQSAEIPAMPLSAINLFPVDFILPLQQIYPKLKSLSESKTK